MGEAGDKDRVLTDEGLPLAGGARVAGDERVGLQTELARVGREDFTGVRDVTLTRERNTLKESLYRRRVSRNSIRGLLRKLTSTKN